MAATGERQADPGGERLARWQQVVDVPLDVAALVFLIAYSWKVIAQVDTFTDLWLGVLILVSWALFPLSYLVEVMLANRHWYWVQRHPFELLVVLVPLLRPLRLLRVVAKSRVFAHSAGTAFRAAVLVYLSGAAVLVTYIAALAVLDAESSDPDANITSFGDAIWWSFVTITTVGYGDFTPLTLRGRVIACVLMLGGVAVLGLVTATLSSWIVQRVDALEKKRDRQAAGDPADE
ncbi:potassium channel family protein [Cryobacterium arcticum]|uniref:Ion transporter n=1 Tax=Cryobacterium arcticum TaxID=670052 RepID=A0A317ZUD2_9MICO|nr:potassium channel family protein [Cryobacterium arcticum]PXA68733.1 ion transporter [Cryobacterium arcticum]